MSATLPPTADLDRLSDFGEFWRHAEAAPRVASLLPEAAPVAQPVAPRPLSDLDQALALARDSVVTVAKLEDWSRLVAQLSPAEQRRVEQQLARDSVKGGRALREAARLELALLWQATARRAKAKKALVSLARAATDPVVRKYALASASA